MMLTFKFLIHLLNVCELNQHAKYLKIEMFIKINKSNFLHLSDRNCIKCLELNEISTLKMIN